MQIITGYEGQPHITAAQDGAVNAGIVGGGSYILGVGGKLAATAQSANEVRISDGVLVMNGRAAAIPYGTYDSLTISNGAQGMLRRDLIVATYTNSGGVESIELEVLTGTPAASSPVDPSYTSGNVYEGDATVQVPLYRVNINGITISSITTLIDVLDPLAGVISSLSDNLGSFKVVYSAISANSGINFTITGNASGLFVVSGQTAAQTGVYVMHKTSSAITHRAVLSGSNIVITEIGSDHTKVEVDNNGSSAIRATYLVFNGDVSL